MSTNPARTFMILVMVALTGCQDKTDRARIEGELQTLNLSRGEIALCGTGRFGEVEFALSCEEKVREDFNLATALLHSFEYVEAEKVFARIIDSDPQCLMAYWGVAMSNFHPLWAPPTQLELEKGSRTIALARSLGTKSPRETQYLEAIATIFDYSEKLEHKVRLEKFLRAAELIYEQNRGDKEAAVFYALALRASADPADKSFEKQRKAGSILSSLFPEEPNHPGIAHYLIHTYDYPELAELGLPAARKYASIAAASAHAQHMPSHIFTRLGLWDESIQSNSNSTDAARCYAEKLGKEGHWDQELHGMDYLVYAYLQQANDAKAKEQVDYLATIEKVFPITFVNAYTFAATPVRYALERKDWKQAASLELRPATFPWNEFPWQKGVFHFGRILGNIHAGDLEAAGKELEELRLRNAELKKMGKHYEANQVQIQITASEAWLALAEGKKKEAVELMIAAADREDATEKHSVTPGEVAPIRELLGDLYMKVGDYPNALAAYKANLRSRPGRFNSVYGAALASKKSGDQMQAQNYFAQLLKLAEKSNSSRPELAEAQMFMKGL